jgi:N-methylhydantoinase B
MRSRREHGNRHRRVTQQIVGNALASIADEMATTIFRTAHSTVVRDGMDFSAAICDPNGETVAQGGDGAVPPRLGAARDEDAAGEVRRRPPPRRRVRDERPVRRGHPPAGHLRLQARLLRRAADRLCDDDRAPRRRGRRLPGSSACDNTEIFQEGIRLPWLRLYDRGEPVEVVFKILRANVRIPRMTLGDLAAQVAATSVAEAALRSSRRATAPIGSRS